MIFLDGGILIGDLIQYLYIQSVKDQRSHKWPTVTPYLRTLSMGTGSCYTAHGTTWFIPCTSLREFSRPYFIFRDSEARTDLGAD